MKFTDFSVKKQFKLITICICLLIIILSSISLFFVHQALIKKNSTYMKDVSYNSQLEISHNFEQISSIINTIIVDPDLEDLLISPYSASTVKSLNNLNRKFDFFSNTLPELADISVCSDDITWSNFFDKKTAGELRKKISHSTELQSLGLMHNPLTTRSAPNNYFIVFAQNIYGITNPDTYGKNLGTLFICLYPDSLLPSVAYENNNYILLADDSEHYYTLHGDDKEGDNIYKLYTDQKDTPSYNDFLISDEYIFHTRTIQDTNYKLIIAFERTDLEKTIIKTFIFLFFIILLSCGVILLLLYLIVNNMILPLEKMAAYMDVLSSSAESTVEDTIHLKGCAEIRTLNNAFSNMLSERKKLTQQLYQTTVNLYETKLQKKEAELKFLRSQVNPHFLYNTLESIKNLALENDVPVIANMTEALSQLFRYNVKGKQMVPLEQELSIVSAYLNIQNIRFGKSLQIIYSIMEDTKKLMVMKFLLQPIIENSIVHGFANRGNSGTLFIASHCHDNKLQIIIQDDGQGISSEQLDKLNFLLQNNPSDTSSSENHLGISNVHHRIQLAYGTEYGLSIESEENGGTRITLSLPIIEPEKEDS